MSPGDTLFASRSPREGALSTLGIGPGPEARDGPGSGVQGGGSWVPGRGVYRGHTGPCTVPGTPLSSPTAMLATLSPACRRALLHGQRSGVLEDPTTGSVTSGPRVTVHAGQMHRSASGSATHVLEAERGLKAPSKGAPSKLGAYSRTGLSLGRTGPASVSPLTDSIYSIAPQWTQRGRTGPFALLATALMALHGLAGQLDIRSSWLGSPYAIGPGMSTAVPAIEIPAPGGCEAIVSAQGIIQHTCVC